MAANQEAVEAVFNALISPQGEQLLVEFWDVIERARVKAGVASFTAEDKTALLCYMCEMAQSGLAPKGFVTH